MRVRPRLLLDADEVALERDVEVGGEAAAAELRLLAREVALGVPALAHLDAERAAVDRRRVEGALLARLEVRDRAAEAPAGERRDLDLRALDRLLRRRRKREGEEDGAEKSGKREARGAPHFPAPGVGVADVEPEPAGAVPAGAASSCQPPPSAR